MVHHVLVHFSEARPVIVRVHDETGGRAVAKVTEVLNVSVDEIEIAGLLLAADKVDRNCAERNDRVLDILSLHKIDCSFYDF